MIVINKLSLNKRFRELTKQTLVGMKLLIADFFHDEYEPLVLNFIRKQLDLFVNELNEFTLKLTIL